MARDKTNQSEWALIAFTALVPAAFGLAAWSLVLLACGTADAVAFDALVLGAAGADVDVLGTAAGAGIGAVAAPAFAVVLATIGMVASAAHLAKPLRAPFSLFNLRSSWLSREIAVVSVFWALLALWLVAAVACDAADTCDAAVALPDVLPLAFCALSVCIGSVLMCVIARAYRVPTRPSWMGRESTVELFAAALGSGACLGLAVLCLCGPSVGLGAVAGAARGAGVSFALGAACALALLIDAALFWACERKRLARLRADNGPSAMKSLEHAAALRPRFNACIVALCVAAVLPFAAISSAIISVALALVALGAHIGLRWLFYETPVQVRHVARLRK